MRSVRLRGVIVPLLVGLGLGVVGIGPGPGPAPLSAQGSRVDDQDDGRLLREAAVHEARGRYDQARDILFGVLEARPGSSGALFALERVLRAQGTVGEILPVVDRYLEVEPRGAGAWHLKLRVLAESDSTVALEPTVRAWMAADPLSVEPYREGARILEEAVGPEQALDLLREGERRVADPTALALELGSVLVQLGRTGEGVEALSRAMGEEGAEVTDVLRLLGELPAPADVARLLVDALDSGSTTPSRRRAGVRIALETGMVDRALELAAGVASELEGTSRTGFLGDLARSGEQQREPGVTLWAYQRLRELADEPSEARALDVRIAGAALAAGDTALAFAAQTRLARALPGGSPERRRVVADLIRVEAGTAPPDSVVRRIETFRREFPGATELDGLAAEVAAALQGRGHGDRARAVLDEVEGPRSALERAYLLFGDGALDEGREALMSALGGLRASRATEAIQLAALLDGLSPGGRELLARLAVQAHRGDPAGASGALVDGLDELPAADRPALLAQAARFADEAGREDESARLRERLLTEHPDRPESAEAALSLARWTARQPGGGPRAMALLESLILGRPDSPVVPAARRQLERLRRNESQETP